MKKTSLRNLVQKGIVRTVGKLRANINEYPYVTMLTSGSKSQNVYFGQTTAELVKDNFSVDDDILEFLRDADVIQTENAAGEIRFKLSKNPNSDYASEQQLADVFGLEIPDGEFDYQLFHSLFQGKDEVITSNSPAKSAIGG